MGRHEHDDEVEYVIERRGGDPVGSFLWGLLLGAGVALLLAPRSGAETQAELRRAARRFAGDAEGRARDLGEQLRERAGDLSGQVRDRVGEQVGRARGTLEDRFAEVREKVEARADVARNAVETGLRTARSAGDDLRRRLDEAKDAARDGVRAARGRDEGRLATDVVVKETVLDDDPGDLAD